MGIKNPGTFGIIVAGNVGAMVIVTILLIVLRVIGLWCCLKDACSLVIVLILRGAALVGTIVAFAFVAVEQKNIEDIVPEAKFGTFWQQILMLVALCVSMVMLVVGALLGVVQVLKGATSTVNFILLVGDSIAALALGAASIAAANVGAGRYFLLRQSIAAWITMGLFLLMMLFDAAQAFGADSTSEFKQETYKPSKQTYKPSQQSKPKD